MDGEPLSSVIRGQPLQIRATTWNHLLAAARDKRQKPRPDAAVKPFVQTGCVEALGFNDTGADLPAFKPAAVAGTGPYLIHSASEWQAHQWSDRPVVTLGVPTASTDMVAVTLEAIPDGQFGRVAVAGWCACDVDVSDAGHGYASPTTDTDALVSAGCGTVRILATGTGTARRTAVYLGDQIPDCTGGTHRTLIDLCVVKNGSGYVTDLKATWLEGDGETTVCETVGECPDGTCGTLWWCTTDGPEEVAVGGVPPTGWLSGPYLTDAEARTNCPYTEVLVSGCATPYPTTITQTFSGFTGGCSGFNGSVDLDWNGAAWTGVYAAPAGNVTITATPSPGGGGSVTFTMGYTSSAYTVSGGGGSASCGGYPAGGVVTLTGGCSGGGTGTLSA